MTLRTAQLLCGATIFLSVLPASGLAQRRPDRPLRRPFRQQQAQSGQLMPELLRRVVAAASSLRLSGQRVVDQKVQGQLVRHEENVLRVGQRTRIWFPPDSKFAGQIIVDNGTFRWRYNPHNQQVNQEPSQRDDTLGRLIGPNNNLLAPRVELADGGMVAGVHTTLAKIENKQGLTVQALYIDPNTSAVLKRVGYDNTGQEVANYEFTSVNYSPTVGASDFEPPRTGKPIVTPEMVMRRQANANGLPALILRPGQGFQLNNSNVVMRANVKVLHEVYLGPGGSGRVSVFLLRAQIDPARLVERAGRLMNAVSTKYNDVTVVLVGPYTQEYLQRLAGTLTPE